MRPWTSLNTKGRMLLVCCILNVLASVSFALSSDVYWIFSISMAMFCGLSTYNSRYDK
jgi:hypothetical protein